MNLYFSTLQMHEVCQCQSNGNPLLIARICRFLAPNVLLFFYWTYFSWTFYTLRSRVSLWCVSTNSFYTNSLQLDYVQLIWKSTRHCLHGNCKKICQNLNWRTIFLPYFFTFFRIHIEFFPSNWHLLIFIGMFAVFAVFGQVQRFHFSIHFA